MVIFQCRFAEFAFRSRHCGSMRCGLGAKPVSAARTHDNQYSHAFDLIEIRLIGGAADRAVDARESGGCLSTRHVRQGPGRAISTARLSVSA